MIEAEGGEYIINRTATAKFKPILESINTGQPMPTFVPAFGAKPMFSPIESEFDNLKTDIDTIDNGLAASFQSGFDGMQEQINGVSSRIVSLQAAFERKNFNVFLEADTVLKAYNKASKQEEKKGKR